MMSRFLRLNVVVSSVSKALVIVLPMIFLTGCVETLFHWGEYENSLIERYVDKDITQTEAHLKELITEAESTQKRVPPGIYADYGFMLYKRGDKSSAIDYFEKEKKLYPESSFFIVKLTEYLNLQSESLAVAGDQ
jgi:hypothetical protein